MIFSLGFKIIILIIFGVAFCTALYIVLCIAHKINDKVRKTLPKLRGDKNDKAKDNW